MSDPLRDELSDRVRDYLNNPHPDDQADAILATLIEHRDEVLDLLGMKRLPGDWCMVHGQILFNPGSVEPECVMAPAYVAVPTAAALNKKGEV